MSEYLAHMHCQIKTFSYSYYHRLSFCHSSLPFSRMGEKQTTPFLSHVTQHFDQIFKWHSNKQGRQNPNTSKRSHSSHFRTQKPIHRIHYAKHQNIIYHRCMSSVLAWHPPTECECDQTKKPSTEKEMINKLHCHVIGLFFTQR